MLMQGVSPEGYIQSEIPLHNYPFLCHTFVSRHTVHKMNAIQLTLHTLVLLELCIENACLLILVHGTEVFTDSESKKSLALT